MTNKICADRTEDYIHRMNERIPMYGGLELVLRERIADLPSEINVFDFKEIGSKYGLVLKEAFFGVNLHVNGKIKHVATPLFVNKRDNRLAIFKTYKNKEGTGLYYAEQYCKSRYKSK